ncbi:MAG: AAA family ATPase, partial [Bacteroidales bacterium]|nr:AAA family ATPase [Bacteroidales bacterium]
MKKLPIGIQSFSALIEEGFVYLDKTDMIYQLANNKACYFLSRPRRFGKSLTLSTLHEYFNGRKDLFVGTKMEQLEQKWDKYPVLHFDFNNATYESLKNLREELGSQLEDMEAIYNITAKGSLPYRFKRLINTAAAQTGKKVVILVDEYDKPLLNNILNEDFKDKIRTVLKPFYSVVKTCDTQIKMAFVPGVTKFSKVSLFSDVNNMTDISNMLDYSTICGATEREIHDQLDGFVQNMADANNMTKDQCYKELKYWYEGFHFSEDSEDIYNPFGLMKALLEKKFKEYWFESGTPTFLVQVIKKRGMKISDLDCVKRTASQLSKIDNFNDDPVPLLFQSGYLTIKGYDPVLKRYTLTMPNKEIGEAFPTFILNYNFPKTDGGDFDITNFIEDV